MCYENDPLWHAAVAPKLKACDYRLQPLTTKQLGSVTFEGYSVMETASFDLLLVDGPGGVDHYSRFSAIELLERNGADEFILIFDDANRPGEQQTIAFVQELLRGRGLDYKLSALAGRTTQAVFTTPRYRAVSYY